MLGRSITEMGSPWEDDPRRVSRRGFKTARSSVLRGPPLTAVGRYVNLDPMLGRNDFCRCLGSNWTRVSTSGLPATSRLSTC